MTRTAATATRVMPGFSQAEERDLAEGAPMSNDTGRTIPLTTITPVKPGWTALQRVVFEVLPHVMTSDELLELSFIQSARWSLITGLSHDGPEQIPERLRYDYLLFESNFNGSLEAYIEAFADVVPGRMKLIWQTAFGFPGPKPLRPFLDYIRRNDFGADHFFSAYPDASNTEVLAALQVHDRVCDLAARAETLDPVSFRGRYHELLTSTQGKPPPLRPPRPPRGNLCGQTYAFTALMPVRSGRTQELRTFLHGLQPHAASPFASVEGLHFARWVLVEDVVHQGGGQRRDSWRNPYLLTSTTSDGGVAPVDRLYVGAGDAADEVWKHCIGYPGRSNADDFRRYFLRHQIRTNRFFSGYPEASVADVLDALEHHARLLDFAHRQQGEADPARLLESFQLTFPARTGTTRGAA